MWSGTLSQHIEEFNIIVATPITVPSSIPFPDTQTLIIFSNPDSTNLQMQYFNGWSNLINFGVDMAVYTVDFTGAQAPPNFDGELVLNVQNIVGTIPDSYKNPKCEIIQRPDLQTNLCLPAELSAPHAGKDENHTHTLSRATSSSTWAALGLGSAAILAI